nr:cytochrome P450 [Tanacetum cinerariifolium]
MYRNCMKNKGKSAMVMIDMKEWFGNLIMNMTVRVFFGYQFSHNKQNADQVKKSIRRFTEFLGAIVPSDVIPGLRWLDLGGYGMEMNKTAKEMDVIVDGWLQEHKKKIDDSKDHDFMTAVLSRVNEELKQDFYGFDIDTIDKSTCLVQFFLH